MINILSWNARGLGSPNKRRALKDILLLHHIDILEIQETKKETFKNRSLLALSSTISHWTFKPSIGASGGLLLGINETKLWILNSWIMNFSITMHIKTKSENFEFLLTLVYGPVLSRLRNDILEELRSIPVLGPPSWLLFGDFNLIRFRLEKQGPSYNYSLSSRFNGLISDLSLIDCPLNDRKFTWARSLSSTSKALLDRFLCTQE